MSVCTRAKDWLMPEGEDACRFHGFRFRVRCGQLFIQPRELRLHRGAAQLAVHAKQLPRSVLRIGKSETVISLVASRRLLLLILILLEYPCVLVHIKIAV